MGGAFISSRIPPLSSLLEPLVCWPPGSTGLPESTAGVVGLDVSRPLGGEVEGADPASGGACVVASEVRNVFSGLDDASGLAVFEGE